MKIFDMLVNRALNGGGGGGDGYVIPTITLDLDNYTYTTDISFAELLSLVPTSGFKDGYENPIYPAFDSGAMLFASLKITEEHGETFLSFDGSFDLKSDGTFTEVL